MIRKIRWWWKVLKQYLSNCNVHGVKYLVSDEYSYFERFFWLVACVLCWYGCSLMIVSALDEFFNRPVAITAETTYVDWQTPFPSLVVCFNGKSSAKDIATKLRGKDKQLQNVQLFSPNSFGFGSRKKNSPISSEDLQSIADAIYVPCEEVFVSCSWNNVSFDCCQEFRPFTTSTGLGYCLAFNSLQSVDAEKRGLKFYVNRTVKYGDLIVDLRNNPERIRDTQMFVINNYNIPILTTTEGALPTKTHTRVDFTMQDTFNTKGVKTVPMERRNCRFADETDEGNLFRLYSSSVCALEVFVNRMLKLCGCVSFYYPLPSGARICNMTEMKCLFENKTQIISNVGLRDFCYPDCEGTTIFQYDLELQDDDIPKDVFRTYVKLLNHPVIRYRRYVVQELLDVVVGIGGALGLFMGASILSLFEIPYWLFVRRDKIS